MNIGADFTARLISKAIRQVIRKKLGDDIDIRFNNIDVDYKNGKAHIRLDAEAELDKEDIVKIIKKAGLS